MSVIKLKDTVFIRAHGLCEYCKSPADISSQPFVIEHIIPKSKTGGNDLNNLALSCQGCNNYKYIKINGIDPISGSEVELFHPRKHKWNDNFAWSSDVIEIVGLTAIGRVTIETLRLNRVELKNLRRLLLNSGKHPPTEQ